MSAQGIDECMINVHYCYYYIVLGSKERAVLPTSQQTGQFPLKHHHQFVFFFLSHPQESSLCSQPISRKVH